jgi:hypothetical protein
MRGLFVIGICVSVVLMAPRVAQACSPLPEHMPGGMTPDDGETNVPTNTWVWLGYGGWSADGASYAAETDVVLRPVGGDPLAVTVSREGEQSSRRFVIVQPDAELLPQTAYEVQTRFKPDCYFDCVQETSSTVATFTTGAGPVLTPPTFGGVTGFSTRVDICPDDACCGPYKAVRLDLQWDTAAGAAAYRIYRDGTFVNAGGLYAGGLNCGNFPFDAFGAFPAASGSYTVHAVSLAGIEDINSAAVQVTLDCAAVIDAMNDGGIDAGELQDAGSERPSAPHDGSTTDDGPASGDGSATHDGSGDGSCIVGATAAGASPALVALVVLTACRRLRGRRR